MRAGASTALSNARRTRMAFTDYRNRRRCYSCAALWHAHSGGGHAGWSRERLALFCRPGAAANAGESGSAIGASALVRSFVVTLGPAVTGVVYTSPGRRRWIGRSRPHRHRSVRPAPGLIFWAQGPGYRPPMLRRRRSSDRPGRPPSVTGSG